MKRREGLLPAPGRLAAAALALSLLLPAAPPAGGAEPLGPDEAAWQDCSANAAELKGRGDFDGARSAFRNFLARYGDGPHAGDARREIETIKEFAERQLNSIYASAQAFSGRGQFEEALEQYTEILTRAPGEEWVRKAREGIERNDAATEVMFNAVRAKCEKLSGEWKFTEAAQDAEKLTGTVRGTKWSEPMAKLTAETAAIRDLFAGLAAKIEKTRANPVKTPFKVKDLTGWLVRAEVIGADERQLKCLVAGAGRNFTWQELLDDTAEPPPARFLGVMDLFAPGPNEQLALGILLYRRGFKKAAEERLRLIEQDENLGAEALRYLELLSGSINTARYDFGSGLQLMDWRADRGRWRIAKGELVQEDENGEADLTLVKQPYRAAEVRFFFQMAIKAGKGPVSVVFRQDEANSFGFTFSPSDGYSAFARVDGKLQTVKDPFKLPAGEMVRLRCGLKGSVFALSVNTTKLPRLTAPGIEKLEGQFTISTVDCSIRLDNVSVSNQVK